MTTQEHLLESSDYDEAHQEELYGDQYNEDLVKGMYTPDIASRISGNMTHLEKRKLLSIRKPIKRVDQRSWMDRTFGPLTPGLHKAYLINELRNIQDH